MDYFKGKYVVGEIKSGFSSFLGAMCFCELFNHSNVRSIFHTIESAGFFHVNDDLSISCYGESVGLKVKSNPERDVPLVAKALGLYRG